MRINLLFREPENLFKYLESIKGRAMAKFWQSARAGGKGALVIRGQHNRRSLPVGAPVPAPIAAPASAK